MKQLIKSLSKSFVLILFCLSAKGIMATDYYWIGGAGHWSDLNHWSFSSGGTNTHLQLPGKFDNVWFDQNSGLSVGDSIILDIQAECKDMSWVAFSGQVIFTDSGATKSIILTGNLILHPGMIFSISTLEISDLGPTQYNRVNRYRTFRMNGVQLDCNLNLGGADHLEFVDNIDLGNHSLYMNSNKKVDFRNIQIFAHNVIINGIADLFFNHTKFWCKNAFILNSEPYILSPGIKITVGTYAKIHNQSNVYFIDTLHVVSNATNTHSNVLLEIDGIFREVDIKMDSVWQGSFQMISLPININRFSITTHNAVNQISLFGGYNIRDVLELFTKKSTVSFRDYNFIRSIITDTFRVETGTTININEYFQFETKKFFVTGSTLDTVRISSIYPWENYFDVQSGYNWVENVVFTNIQMLNQQGVLLNAPFYADGGGNSGISFLSNNPNALEDFYTLNPSEMTFCKNQTVYVPFVYNGPPLSSSNIFYLMMSNSSGIFSDIHSVISQKTGNTSDSFTINLYNLPNFSPSSLYRFRVFSSELPGFGYSKENPDNVTIGMPVVVELTPDQFVEPGEAYMERWSFYGAPPYLYSYSENQTFHTITTDTFEKIEFKSTFNDRNFQIQGVGSMCGSFYLNCVGCLPEPKVLLTNGFSGERPYLVMSGDTSICRDFSTNSNPLRVNYTISGTQNPENYKLWYESSESPGVLLDIDLVSASGYFEEFPVSPLVVIKPLYLEHKIAGYRYDLVTGACKAVVHPIPKANLSLAPGFSASVCQNASVNLQVVFTHAPGPWDITYDFLGSPVSVSGITSNPFVFSVNPIASSTYSLESNFASVSNQFCSSNLLGNSGEVILSVVPTPVLSVLSTDTSLSYCTPTNAADTFKYKINLSGGSGIFSIGIQAGSNTLLYHNLQTGDTALYFFPSSTTTYNTVSIASGSCNTGVIGGFPVTASVVPAGPLSVQISGSQTVCPLTPFLLQLTSSGPFPYNAVYSNGNYADTLFNITANSYNFYASVANSSSYTLLNVNNKCGMGSSSGFASVAVVNQAVSSAFNILDLGANTYQFSNLSSGADSYHWDFGDGITINGNQNIVNHTYNYSGYYQVQHTASNSCNSQTSMQTIGALSMDSDGLLTNFSIFPVPTNDEFSIHNESFSGELGISVLNTSGQLLLFKSVYIDHTCTVSLREFPSGVYYVKLQSGEKSNNFRVILAK